MAGHNTFSCYIEGQQYFLCAENNEVLLMVSNNTSSVKWLNGIQPCIRLKLKKVPSQKMEYSSSTQLSRVAKWNLKERSFKSPFATLPFILEILEEHYRTARSNYY